MIKNFFKLNYLLDIVVGVTFSTIIITFYLSTQPILEELKTPKRAIKVINGQPFSYCRTVEYFNEGKITLDKSLIKNTDSGEIITLSYPSHTFAREKGKKTICKDMVLPMVLEEGIWTVETIISYKVFPFWTGHQKLENVYLDISNK